MNDDKISSNQKILHSPYNFSWEFPNIGNITKYLVEKSIQFCNEGFGEQKWIINTETGVCVTLSQVEPLTRNIAYNLRQRGMKSGDIFLFNSHDPTKLHLAALGVWRAGGTLRSIYPLETVDTIHQIIQESHAKWFLVDPDTVKIVLTACKKVSWPVEIIVSGQSKEKHVTPFLQLIRKFEDDESKDFEIGDNRAIILPTSGTTGNCKGCVYTQAQSLKTLFAYKQRLFSHNDQGIPFKLLTVARPTHIGGFFSPFASLVANKTIMVMGNVVKENIFRAVDQFQPDALAGFPTRLCDLLDPLSKKYDLSSIKIIFSSGASLTKHFVDEIKLKLNVQVVNIYGMTECSGSYVSNKNFDPQTQDQHLILQDTPDLSSGKLLPGTHVQVRNIETGEHLSEHQLGELCFKSPLQCSGYFKETPDTKNTFSTGWIRSGDIGYYDENGFIYIVDRLKECFKYFNNHISPSELENILMSHPLVEKSCVVGVPECPKNGNTIPRAFVTLKNGVVTSSEEIRKFANEKLASYKQLRGGLFILSQMPLGKTGKIDTIHLKKLKLHALH